jgi:hypothetical protein
MADNDKPKNIIEFSKQTSQETSDLFITRNNNAGIDNQDTDPILDYYTNTGLSDIPTKEEPETVMDAVRGSETRPDKAASISASNSAKNFVEVFTTYSQLHVFTSQDSIVDNSIKASKRDICTNAAAIYTLGGSSSDGKLGPVVMADYTIKSELQKTEVVDSGTVQNFVGPDGIYRWVGFKPGEAMAKKFAKSHLVDKMREMYQGELLILGTASLKPYDFFLLNDTYNKMYGAAEVGRVVHHLGADTGFVSSIKPDLCARSVEEAEVWNNLFSRIMAYSALYAVTIAQFIYLARTGTSIYSAARTGKLTASITKAGQGFMEQLRLIRTVRGIGNKVKTAKTAIASIGIAAAPETLGVSLIALAISMLVFSIIENTIQGIVDFFGNRNTIKIYPLFYKDKEFVAGINGSENLIVWGKEQKDGVPKEEYGHSYIPNDPIQGGNVIPVGLPGQSPLPDGRFLVWPGNGGVITSGFGVDRGTHKHGGIDIAFSPVNAQINAAQYGTVIFSDKLDGYGNTIRIDHGNGVETLYAHLSEFKVSKGNNVAPGQQIGNQGSTGRSTGPHLHFEVKINGARKNPLLYVKQF